MCIYINVKKLCITQLCNRYFGLNNIEFKHLEEVFMGSLISTDFRINSFLKDNINTHKLIMY